MAVEQNVGIPVIIFHHTSRHANE